MQSLIEQPDIIAQLKYLSEQIAIGNDDMECNIVIISSTAAIPKELAPYTTILSMEYLNTDEIKRLSERTPAYRGGSFLLPREQHH
jgi:hypothetical protein